MKESIQEWLDKAEGDFHSALREHRARKHPNYDAACFHAQQCVEKYLKAVLEQEGIPFTKTHDLDYLLSKCIPLFPLWEVLRADLKRLSRYAVQFRYPGESADREESAQSIRIVTRAREEIRTSLDLSV